MVVARLERAAALRMDAVSLFVRIDKIVQLARAMTEQREDLCSANITGP